MNPHKCPICVGSGCYAPSGTYAHTPTRFSHPCYGCAGSGIVWGPPCAVQAVPSDFGFIPFDPSPVTWPFTVCGVPARDDIVAWN